MESESAPGIAMAISKMDFSRLQAVTYTVQYTARRYASAVYAVVVCLCVCPSVSPSVRSRHSTKTAKHRITQDSAKFQRGHPLWGTK